MTAAIAEGIKGALSDLVNHNHRGQGKWAGAHIAAGFAVHPVAEAGAQTGAAEFLAA